MLSRSAVAATLPFRGLKKAKAFYSKKLGLRLESEKGDGDRVYRIVTGKTTKPKAKAGAADRPAA